ncbi:MAG TPA: lmo0937 family membrane protein [Pirellulales bacterium]|nr:lmo0937 family membrane protein [Pirellulales bacterium]
MLWALLSVLLLMWACGLAFGVAGNLIHVLFAAALVVLVIQLVQNKKAVRS